MCPHGFEISALCKGCKADSKRIYQEMIESGEWLYAAIPWRGDNQYKIQDAVKTYKSKSAAERFAEPRELVVRMVRVS